MGRRRCAHAAMLGFGVMAAAAGCGSYDEAPGGVETDTHTTDETDGSVGCAEETAFYLDCDGDGAPLAEPMSACTEEEAVAKGRDARCGGNDPVVIEVPSSFDCDDDDADLVEPSAWYGDCDGDGFFGYARSSCGRPTGGCENAGAEDPQWREEPPSEFDCDDDDSSVNPSAAEVAQDGIDQDCTGVDMGNCPTYVYEIATTISGWASGTTCSGGPGGVTDVYFAVREIPEAATCSEGWVSLPGPHRFDSKSTSSVYVEVLYDYERGCAKIGTTDRIVRHGGVHAPETCTGVSAGILQGACG